MAAIVLHELLEIALGRVTAYVREVLIPEVAESSQRLADNAFVMHKESVIETLNHALRTVYNALQEVSHEQPTLDQAR